MFFLCLVQVRKGAALLETAPPTTVTDGEAGHSSMYQPITLPSLLKGRCHMRQLTVSDASEVLGIDIQSVYSFIKNGDLEAIDVRRPGKKRATYRISEQAIQDFRQRRTVRPSEPRQAPVRKRTSKPSRQWV